MAVDEIPAAAVVMACKAFIQGKVDDWNADFAPSAPRLAKEAKAIQERMKIEAFWDKTEFVAVGSPKWRALEKSRGRSMPVVERDGVSGWYVAKDEVAAIPAQMLIEDGNERAFSVPKPGRMD